MKVSAKYMCVHWRTSLAKLFESRFWSNRHIVEIVLKGILKAAHEIHNRQIQQAVGDNKSFDRVSLCLYMNTAQHTTYAKIHIHKR